MRLAELVAGLEVLGGAGTPAVGPEIAGPEIARVEIAGLAYDSRKVAPGTLFFCVPGQSSDGHDFAAQALRDGAVALVVERSLSLDVPEVLVPSARAAMGPVAARFNGDPTSRLQVLGVTGTNGKTTTAFLMRALLETGACVSPARSDRASGGVKTGLLGTVTSIVGGTERPVQRTTPEAIDLQASLREMLDAGDRACAMEVSSHALAMGRTRGIRFAAGVFTNLSRDHLDYHATMEDYYQAKRRLFVPDDGPAPGVSVVNVGDPYGDRLAAELDGVLTFALEDPRADYRATNLRCDAAGCRFVLHTPATRGSAAACEVTLPMPGRFNVANALGALAAAHALGHELAALVPALERGVRVPGRFEPVDEGQEFSVLVRLRAHARLARERAGRGARAGARAGASRERVRGGRRPRPRQASADGQDLGAPGRPHDRHL